MWSQDLAVFLLTSLRSFWLVCANKSHILTDKSRELVLLFVLTSFRSLYYLNRQVSCTCGLFELTAQTSM